ncbi:MAG: beta-lactamase family protein [Saprospirales bacterium]|nr:beta-lactamase family protein [Saprospirales bacterium]
MPYLRLTMIKGPRIGALFLLFFLIASGACTHVASRESKQAPLPPALRNPHLRALLAEFDRFFADSMARSQTPGAALVIVKDSVVVFQRSYGLKASNRPSDTIGPNTVFRIGSLSKGFAGVLTGILVEDGQLRWDDPILRYVPEFRLSSPEQTRQVQLAHLLSHTTGLPYHAYTNLVEAGYDLRFIAGQFARLPLQGNPGAVFSYQNAAFSLIGEAMEASTGKTYAELLMKKIFRPAGMIHASADWESIRRCADLALPHVYTGAGWLPDTLTRRFYNAAPAGGVNASIADMGQWLLVLLGHKPGVVSAGTLNQVFQPRIKTNNERRHFNRWAGPKEASYAMGWRILVQETDTLVYHGGSVNDFRSEIAFHRADGIGICILFNSASPLANTCIPAFWERYCARRDSILRWKVARPE